MENVKEHYNHWLPKMLNVDGITISNNIYYAMRKNLVTERLRRHEKAHVLQYARDGTFGFLLKYLFEYTVNRIKGMSHFEAYQNISYEIEARQAENS